MEIKTLQSDDWEAMKDLRLKALKENPEAFARTYEEEVVFPDDIWKSRTASASEGKERICYLCFDGNHAVGIAGSSKHKQKAGVSVVNGVWVDPICRGTGAAISLMDSLASWATSIGMQTMEGYVTRNNERALAFYRKYGFEITEVTTSLERDPSIVSVLIRIKLDANQTLDSTSVSAAASQF